jgi:DNA-3-methyladenine glycosylase II
VKRVDRFVVGVDPAFAAVVKAVGPMRPPPPAVDAFAALTRMISFQQLAGAAARAIYGRFVALFDGTPTPAAVLAAPPEALRGAGLSLAKYRSILDLAAKCTDGTIPLHDLADLSDEDVTARLTKVRGIGVWTAQMFLMFQLGRPDVWPVLDLGVRNGWARVHRLPVPPTSRELEPLGEPFRPHRSATAWYCWRAVATVVPA